MNSYSVNPIKTALAVAAVCLVTFRTFSALRSEADTPAEPAPLLRAGFIVPLSGPLAEFGTAIQNGVILAMEDDTRAKAVFVPIYEDSRYDSAAAVSAFHKLTAGQHVNLTYIFGGPMSESLAPIAESQRVPSFSTEYGPALSKGRNYFFRFANTSYDFAEQLLADLRTRGFKNFVLIKCENQYHNTLVDAFLKRLAADESAAVIANHLPGDQDFRTTISKLRAQKFDALGVYLLPGMQNAFMRQLQAQQLTYPLFGTDTFETDSENLGVEQTVAGAVYANALVDEKFVNRYRERFGNTSQIVHAAHAYEFARLLTDLFAGASHAASAEEIVSGFRKASVRKGVLGAYAYVNDQNVGQHFKFPLTAKHVQFDNFQKNEASAAQSKILFLGQ